MRNIVIGSGPAGMTAAMILALRGERVILVERSTALGGLWRGFDYPAPRDMSDPLASYHFETGMHWYTTCGIPQIDNFWIAHFHPNEIGRERAGCYWNNRLQLNSPYPDLRDGGTFLNTPILENLWGVPIQFLADHAGKLLKIDRHVCFDEGATLRAYEENADTRQVYAWPEQRTLPKKYQSGARHFYPVEGMRAMVEAAARYLSDMGVMILTGKTDLLPMLRDLEGTGCRMIWAAGIKSAAQFFGIPCETTPGRHVRLVNCLRDEPAPHDLHYALGYDTAAPFRTTWYGNFTEPRDCRVSFEYVNHPEEISSIEGHAILGQHDLGPVLPVPSIENERALRFAREQMSKLARFTLVGAGAEEGLFYQPEILRHVAEVV